MDFSKDLDDFWSRIVIKSDKISNEEKDRLLSPDGINYVIEDKPPVFFQFDKQPVLEAVYLGPAPDYMDGETPVKCWKFKDMAGTIYYVPKYEELTKEKGKFKGFDNEIPGERKYQIIYTGEQKLDAGGFYYKFTVFHKNK